MEIQTCRSCPNYSKIEGMRGKGFCNLYFEIMKGVPVRYPIMVPAKTEACEYHPALTKLLRKEE